jgi:hypothetical protein
MVSRNRVRLRLYVLIGACCVIPCVLIFSSLPWLKQQPQEMALLITAIGGFVTILAGLSLAFVHDRTMDEWQRSNSRFSSFWGDAAGTALVGLLLNLQVGRDWIFSAVSNLAAMANVSQTEPLVILAFVFGFAVVTLARGACMALLGLCWAIWKSRPAPELS